MPLAQKSKVNSEITAPELRVIDVSGKNLGVLSRDEALALADPTKGIDLVEISPKAKPPVARLVNFDKYRYQEEKARKKEMQAQRSQEMKQVQISARAATNDLQTKMRRVEKFLEEGRPVEIQLRLRGREKGNKEWAKKKLLEFLDAIPQEYKTLRPPFFGGRGMIVQIGKK